MKKFFALFLIVPVLMFCTPNNGANQEENKEQTPEGQTPEGGQEPEEDLYAKAEAEITEGAVVQATNPIAEKFVNEVTYPDKTYTEYTKVLDYYGGFNGKAYNSDGEEDPNGVILKWGNAHKWPNGDRPMRYSIRWTKDALTEGSAMTLKMQDNKGWKGEMPIKADMCYVNFSCLVPGTQYTYTVTADDGGKVIKQGSFSTKASSTLHQVFFTGTSENCRNGRDLGGWETADHKHVKYHKLYRGGRMQSSTINSTGKNEVLFEGIGAQLDLRNSDRLAKPAVSSLEFLAPGIEEGGQWMLKNGNSDGNFGKQCFEFIVKCLRENKPVYFHCSLGRDRTGTLDILLLGLLGVPEGQIGVAYEVTYFAPVGYSVSSSEQGSNPEPIFKNTRMAWAYSDVVPYFWELAGENGTFADGVEKYLLDVAGVSQKDIDDFRSMMLE